jgi:hypothetical protein
LVQPNCYYSKKRDSSDKPIPQKNEAGSCREYNYRAYAGSTGLDKYFFSVLFYYNDSNTGESGEGILTIRK